MNPKVAKRRDFLIDLVYVMAIIGLVYVFFKYCFVIAAPFLLSFFFAVILQRPLGWLDKKTKNKMHSFVRCNYFRSCYFNYCDFV